MRREGTTDLSVKLRALANKVTGNAQNLQKAKKQTIEKEKHDSRQNASIVDEAAANTSATKQQPEEAPQLSGTISSSSLSDFGMLF